MKNITSVIVIFVLSAILFTSVHAEVPRLINYQGILADTDGTPLDGLYDLTFTIYPDSAQGADDLWVERHTDVLVDEGLFNVILGHIATIPDSLFAGEERWLGIKVDPDPEMKPRLRLTSVPWAFRAAIADSAASGADTDWLYSGEDIYSGVSGNIGIGTSNPLSKLHIKEVDISLPMEALSNECITIEDTDAGLGLFSNAGGSYGSIINLGEIDGGALTNNWSLFRMTGSSPQLRFSFGTTPDYSTYDPVLTMLSDGRIGIGINTPARKLEVWDNESAYARLTSGNTMGSILELKSTFTGLGTSFGTINFLDDADNIDASIRYMGVPFYGLGGLMFYIGGDLKMIIHRDTGYVGIGTSNPEEMLDVAGTVKAEVLRLSSGADIAEPFDIGGSGRIEPGMVVVIDADNPGMLRLCDESYDRCAAGVISGAGELNPGMLMGQKGSIADGDYPIALTGRVYCLVDASNSPVKPGDLLTTSDTPGHAMKVTDHERAQGAVIGKAMSSLDEGRGLVLVLVSLQ